MILTEEQQRKYDSIASIGSERAILSIALHNPEALFDITIEIQSSDFVNIQNRNIYGIMTAILDGKYANVGKVNPVVIQAIAQQSGSVEDIGGMQYLEMVQRTQPDEENLEFFITKVKQASVRRDSFMRALSVMEEAVSCEDEDVDSFTSRQEEKFLDIIMKSKGSNDIVRIGDVIDVHLDNLATNPREMLGVPTGFHDYDRQTGGAVPGRLKCIAATAKTGKSALALNMAKHISINENVPVLYIDTEMQTNEQIDRLTSIVATELSGVTVPESAVSKGLYARNPAMADAVNTAKELIKQAPLYHFYMPEFTPEKVHNLARKFQRQHGIDWNGYEKQFVLIFDYIKMPDESFKGNVSEYLILGQITSMLKNRTAGMLNIPVITFAQLNPRTANNTEEVNSSQMSGSNRIVMYVNELAFLRKKTEKEMADDGPENGNLVLELGETRNGGAYKGWIHYDIRRGVTSMREIRNVALTA